VNTPSGTSVSKTGMSRRQVLSASLAVTGGIAGSRLLSGCGLGSGSGGGSDEVVALGWVPYVDAKIAGFMADAGLKLKGVPAETDQEMFTKIKAGGASYDIVFCNCGWSPTYYKAGLVEAFDVKTVPGWDEISPVFVENTSLPYVVEPNKVTMFPNTFDSYGLIWNTEVPYQPSEPYSWRSLWSSEVPKGKVVMKGGPEDFLAASGLSLGVPKDQIWSMAGDQLQQAAEHLAELKPFQIAASDDVFENALVSEKAWIGMCTQLAAAPRLNSHEGRELAKAVIPQEGSIGWIDGPQIVKGAQNRENAVKFVEVFNSKPVQEYLWTTYGFSPCNATMTQSILDGGGADAEKLRNLGGDNPENATELVFQGPPDDPEEWARAYDQIVGSS
jgi:spermidine/putrescine transport system substrate-binding protein